MMYLRTDPAQDVLSITASDTTPLPYPVDWIWVNGTSSCTVKIRTPKNSIVTLTLQPGYNPFQAVQVYATGTTLGSDTLSGKISMTIKDPNTNNN